MRKRHFLASRLWCKAASPILKERQLFWTPNPRGLHLGSHPLAVLGGNPLPPDSNCSCSMSGSLEKWFWCRTEYSQIRHSLFNADDSCRTWAFTELPVERWPHTLCLRITFMNFKVHVKVNSLIGLPITRSEGSWGL